MESQKVIAISRGKGAAHDTISQKELRQLASLQAQMHQAAALCITLTLQLEQRIADGATVENGDLAWDRRLRMARTFAALGICAM